MIASWHLERGGVGNWQRSQVMISDIAIRLGRLGVNVDLSDSMSVFS